MRKNRKAKEFGRQPQCFMRCGCLFADKSSKKETKHRLKNFAAIWNGKEYIEFRQKHILGDIPNICKFCYKEGN
jgi:hypothetical protein